MSQDLPSPGPHPRRGSPVPNRLEREQVVVMRGEHDPSTVASLAQMLSSAIAVDDGDLVVDVSEVPFLDASTLGVFVRTQNLLLDRSRALLVRSPSAFVRRLFDICDLGSLLEAPDERAVAGDPARVGALDTWVAVPATIPEQQPSPRSPADTSTDAGTVGADYQRRTPPLALIGVPAAPSGGRVVNPARCTAP